MKAQIELHWQTREGQVTQGHQAKAEWLYLDFLVNGRSLKDWLALETEHIGIIGWQNLASNKAALDQLCLLQPSSLESGRVSLYVCPECADIDCEIITMSIQDQDSTIVWERFGYENGYLPVDESEYQGLSFEFDKVAYLKSFKAHRGSFGAS